MSQNGYWLENWYIKNLLTVQPVISNFLYSSPPRNLQVRKQFNPDLVRTFLLHNKAGSPFRLPKSVLKRALVVRRIAASVSIPNHPFTLLGKRHSAFYFLQGAGPDRKVNHTERLIDLFDTYHDPAFYGQAMESL